MFRFSLTPLLLVACGLSATAADIDTVYRKSDGKSVGGEITAVSYRPGKFLNASLDKASVDNERNSLAVRIADGRQIAVVQIAGLVARRIVCDVKPGAVLETGERFGMIRFGSRLDVYLPPGVVPMVALGQTMVAGETVLADLAADEPARTAEVR